MDRGVGPFMRLAGERCSRPSSSCSRPPARRDPCAVTRQLPVLATASAPCRNPNGRAKSKQMPGGDFAVWHLTAPRIGGAWVVTASIAYLTYLPHSQNRSQTPSLPVADAPLKRPTGPFTRCATACVFAPACALHSNLRSGPETPLRGSRTSQDLHPTPKLCLDS
jgi:hypothetical protein